MSKIRKLTSFGTHDWEKYLQNAINGINISFSRALGTSSYELINKKIPIITSEEKRLRIQNKKIVQKSNISKMKLKQNFKNYHKSIRTHKNFRKPFNLGNRVWYWHPPHQHNKLQTKWIGKGTITGVKHKSYELILDTGKKIISHEKFLKSAVE